MQHIKEKMRTLTLLLIASILTSCNGQESTVSDPSKDLTEGELVYSISGEYTTSGWGFDVQFDSNNVRINEKNTLTASRTYIFDKTSKEILALINDFKLNRKLKDSYFIYYTPQEFVRLGLSSNYGDTVKTITQEFKNILGYKCQKTILKLGRQATVEIWTTNKIKTGIIIPRTPLSFENVAFEYELKIEGRIYNRYVIKSISDKKIPKKDFEHIVPDEYFQVVPVSVFSLDSVGASNYKEKKFSSFQYPTYGDGRDAVKKYIKDGLSKFMVVDKKTRITIDFIVSKDGTLKDITIDYGRKSQYTDDIRKILLNMPKWTSGRVMGKPVNSKLKILI